MRCSGRCSRQARQEQAYYDAHKQEFEQPEQIKLERDPDSDAGGCERCGCGTGAGQGRGIRGEVEGGREVRGPGKAVLWWTDGADKGGDLGLFKRGALAKVLEDKTFPLKAGEWTAPIRTRQGFVMLKVTDHVRRAFLR